ncbi:hypothetical protein H8S95_02995 [Pontibacter sp. KCTC 32443]|uniref:hypothetical protein n=1 Tax=Pontibacter TaxID=323449 RepID=UPI00164DBD5A|nr:MULTISPECIES: hypothetical protein [Pontibacter]MBC5773018.1 hypothetical protein [Pontibacter sp. KCTC 32443]
MEMQGTWSKDEEGFMTFEPHELQRYYEAVTDKYHQVYNRYLNELDDDEDAYYKALQDGFEMITDYKIIDGREEFATTYITPAYVLDIWYETDELTEKRDYTKGFVKISSKPEI